MTALCLALFWLAAAVILYTYVGYPVLIGLLARLRPRPWIVAEDGDLPQVDVLVAAYNEADCIAAKIANTRALDYPPDRLALWVVADGSTDDTPAIVASEAKALGALAVHLLHQPERQGKAAALGRALPHLSGAAILFTDANSHLPPETLRRLVRHLADPQVAAASGAKAVRGNAGAAAGEGLYWRYEAYLKACDSTVGSVMGVPGEVWLAQRALYRAPEADVLLEDFVASMRLVAAGWRVVYDPTVCAMEDAAPGPAAEWERHARNAAGGWQACVRLGEVWHCGDPLAIWQFVSHRVLRWMATPALFPLLLVANLGLLATPFYRGALIAQGLAYAAAALGWALAAAGRRPGPLAAPLAVALLNSAALAGAWRHLRGRQAVTWDKVR